MDNQDRVGLDGVVGACLSATKAQGAVDRREGMVVLGDAMEKRDLL